MRITKYGHACLLIETGEARLLVDPGAYSDGFQQLTELSAILYTHDHGDHYDAGQLTAVLDGNSSAQIIADEGTAKSLAEADRAHTVVHDGDTLEVAGVSIKVIGSEHAIIHPALGAQPNVGYLIDGRLFVPGDALTVPGEPIEILALPIVAPWSKVQETADYLLEVKPKVAFPVHDAVASSPDMYMQMVGGVVKDADIELKPLSAGETLDLG